MTDIVEARGLRKRFGDFKALDGLDFSVARGSICGLIGPNGAGKTTTLKALVGLSDVEGDLRVAGRDPRISRHKLMEEVCFIADVGILPKWFRVNQVLDYVESVHPRFSRQRAEEILATTDGPSSSFGSGPLAKLRYPAGKAECLGDRAGVVSPVSSAW